MSGFTLSGCELGVATAATQIEGGAADTTWHRWAAADRITDHSTPARAADHWNRVEQDVALLGELGVRHYRMGLEWARIEPLRGQFDPAGFAHYRDEFTRLRDAGIRPLVTLHHFSEPGWFADAGGWLAPDAVPTFLRFAEAVVSEFADLVSDWITINEPTVYASHAYLWGLWPPGETSAYRRALAVTQALVDAHLAAYPMIHRLCPDAKVGVAHHLRVFGPRSPRNPLHRGASALSRYLFQDALVEVMATGRSRPPLRRPKAVVPGRYYDFHGINYYTRSTVAGLADGTAANVPVNDLGWEVYPRGIVELARWMHARWPGPIWITENGTADAADAFRSRYVYEHLAQIAVSDLPIERYYHWCFTDNFEWAEGEGARFGLVDLDFGTQVRTVRESGRFYADIIANHGVTDAAYDRWVAGQEYPTNGEDG
ncbi:MAG: glycoside hydrolase family 1 protein [Actinobacteria bacterium HGW-Actinobacteria-5]|jgi:beta-glucosidase|nr:MAG: glycoside hydrolase family 1 protein [Actinobacteria bacterium HGW-Actinobacteria-5]